MDKKETVDGSAGASRVQALKQDTEKPRAPSTWTKPRAHYEEGNAETSKPGFDFNQNLFPDLQSCKKARQPVKESKTEPKTAARQQQQAAQAAEANAKKHLLCKCIPPASRSTPRSCSCALLAPDFTMKLRVT
eukprot:3789260-Prymnesium_polylepis.1